MEAIQNISEAQLVRLSVSGDRGAFEEIVRRNVSPVAAVAYALTGDAATSEDVTQEVFLKAWQRLRDLREPEKLRSWLCAIARNVAYALGRKSTNDPLKSARTIEESHAVAAVAPSPADKAIASEQQRLVWAAIEQIPENYRLPLVLYYREGHSAAQVAEALELTEEAVRQRLSRARAMLKEEVARMVETSISASRPSPLLVTAIMATLAGGALHASAATTTAAAVAKMTGAGGAAGGAAISGAVLGSVLGPVVGIGGGIAGCAASLSAAKTPAERTAVIRMIWVVWALIASWLLALFVITAAATHHWLSHTGVMIAGGLALAVYTITLISLVRYYNRKLATLAQQRPDPPPVLTPLQRHQQFIQNLPRGGRYGLYGGYGGAIYGSTGWMLVEAALLKQPGTFAAIFCAATVIYIAAVRASSRKPWNYLLHMAMTAFAVTAMGLAVVLYWRANAVTVFLTGLNLEGNWEYTTPLLACMVICALVPVGIALLFRHRKMMRLYQDAGIKYE